MGRISKFSEFFLNRKLKLYCIEKYTINSDGTIDVDGDVSIIKQNIKTLPFKFGKVSGNFFIYRNNLESLEGSPYYVGGNFDCSHNSLKSLKCSPGEVVKTFDCSNNYLTSLEGMPLEIGGNFYCVWNGIKELDSISNIEGEIHCDKTVDVSKFAGDCEAIDNHYESTSNLNKTNELFYYDGGPRYGSAKDPSIPKYYDLAKERYFYSEIDKRYYDDYEIQEFERLYYTKFQKKVKIRNEGDLDLVIKKLKYLFTGGDTNA